MAARVSVPDLLARSALFRVLNPAERAALAGRMRNVSLTPGQSLFSRGDPGRELYLVTEGRIRLSVLSADGRQLSFAHAIAGDVFGEIAALDGAPRSADAHAITHVSLRVLSQAALHQLLSTNAEVSEAAIKLLCGRLREVSDHFEAIALHPVEVRLARLLLDRVEEIPALANGPVASLRLEMTQTELALLIGTTRQRANTALTALEKAGAINRSGDLLECTVQVLKRIAQRDFD